jgi:hypothetical protein
MELRLGQRQSLSASWLVRLVREAGYDVPQTRLSVAPFIIGRPDGFNITVTPQDTAPWIAAVSSDQSRQDEIDEVVRRSGELCCGALMPGAEFGGHVWYTSTLIGEAPNLADPMFFSRVQEMLGAQVRIVDEWRRLGPHVLLNFREDGPEGDVRDDNFLFLRGRSLTSTSLLRDRSTDRSSVPSPTAPWSSGSDLHFWLGPARVSPGSR